MDTLAVFLLDLAYNLVRAFCAVTMLMVLLKHWTAKIAGSLPPIEEVAGGRTRPQRFGDWFQKIATQPIGLAILLGAGMLTFGQVVVAVWK